MQTGRGPTSQVLPASDTAREVATSLLDESREEVARADSKASILLGAAGLSFGAIVTGLLEGRWSPLRLDVRVQWLWWVGVAVILGAFVLLCMSIYPRVRMDLQKEKLSFFGHVAQFDSPEELANAIMTKAERQFDRLVDQLFVVSRILIRKYRFMRAAFWSFGIGIVLCLVAILADHLLRAA